MEQTKNVSCKSSGKFWLILLLVLAVVGLFVTVYTSVSNLEHLAEHGGADLASFIMYLMLLWYALWGYRVPHGNALRYCFLLYALTAAVLLLITVANGDYQIGKLALDLLSMLLAAYIGGRLQKFNKNRVLMALTGLILLASALLMTVHTPGPRVEMISGAAPAISQWTGSGAPTVTAPLPDGQTPAAAPAETQQQPDGNQPPEERHMNSVLHVLLPFNQLILWICLCIAYGMRYREHTEAGLQDR